MVCYECGSELIWGGDDEGDDEHALITNLSCPECGSFTVVYWSKRDEDEDTR